MGVVSSVIDSKVLHNFGTVADGCGTLLIAFVSPSDGFAGFFSIRPIGEVSCKGDGKI